MEAESAAPTDHSDRQAVAEEALQVVEQEVSGRSFVAQRSIQARALVLRERPLLQRPPLSHPSELTEACLRAFCRSSDSVQQKVLSHFFAPVEEVEAATAPPNYAQMRQLLDLAEGFAPEPWASAHTLGVLRKALLCFHLNSHLFEKGAGALFERGCLFNHACDANAAYFAYRGELCHVALRPIDAGDAVTVNYLGSDAIIGTPMRQALMHVQKLFLCSCSRCRAPDLCRAMPCLHCHVRPIAPAATSAPAAPSAPTATSAPAATSTSYMVPRPIASAVADAPAASGGSAAPAARPWPVEWRCETCQQEWSDQQVQALSAATPGSGDWEGGEFMLSNAVFRYAREWMAHPVDAFDAHRLQQVRDHHTAVRRALGDRHWATARMAMLLAHVLGSALAGPDATAALATLGVSAPEAAEEFAAQSDLCWRFCAEASLPAALLADVFCAGAVEAPILRGALGEEAFAELWRRARAAALRRQGEACAGSRWHF